MKSFYKSTLNAFRGILKESAQESQGQQELLKQETVSIYNSDHASEDYMADQNKTFDQLTDKDYEAINTWDVHRVPIGAYKALHQMLVRPRWYPEAGIQGMVYNWLIKQSTLTAPGLLTQGLLSAQMDVTTAVPQGSVPLLSTFLFLN